MYPWLNDSESSPATNHVSGPWKVCKCALTGASTIAAETPFSFGNLENGESIDSIFNSDKGTIMREKFGNQEKFDPCSGCIVNGKHNFQYSGESY